MQKLISLVVLAASILVGCNSNPEPTPATTTTPTAAAVGTNTPSSSSFLMQPGLGDGVHILSNYLVRFPVYGVQIIALAQNNTDKLISTPEYVTADFLDSSGKKIGSAFGLLNSIPPRSVKIFLMAGTDQVPNYSKVTFKVGQIIDGNPEREKIKIGQPTISNNISGTHVRVPIENLSTSSKSVVLIAGFFDSKGKIVGAATGGRLNLAPGAHELTLDSEGIVPEFSRIEVQLDSLL